VRAQIVATLQDTSQSINSSATYSLRLLEPNSIQRPSPSTGLSGSALLIRLEGTRGGMSSLLHGITTWSYQATLTGQNRVSYSDDCRMVMPVFSKQCLLCANINVPAYRFVWLFNHRF
jgi:hypothetical protein